MQLPVKLYSYDTKSKLREWSVEVEEGRYRTIHGLVGGKLQTTKWTEVSETNVGRSNHRDLKAQAIFEADALVKKQIEQGWRTEPSLLDQKSFDCMLAQKWEDRMDEVSYPLYSSSKLDGIRLNITKDKLLSRNKKEFVSVPHLNPLKEYCKQFNMVLDGELYNHQFKDDFNAITSIVKKTKPTKEDLEKSAKVMQYWVYDAYFLDEPDMVFSERYNRIFSLFKKEKFFLSLPFVKILPITKIESLKELNKYYEQYLEQGYEGQMIRIDKKYEQKRSKYLLKRKEFQDSEYIIVDICEGNGNKSGMAGYMILQNTDGSTFKSNIKGDQEHLSSMLQAKRNLIGKFATVKYFNLTPDGVPRFPYVIAVRDFE